MPSERACKPESAAVAASHEQDYLLKGRTAVSGLVPVSRASLPLHAASRRLAGRPASQKTKAFSGPRTEKRKVADESRRQNFGLTPGQYDHLAVEAAGHCALCGRQDQGDRLTGLVVDHDHATGRVRGLLCGICNRALAFLEKHGHGHEWQRQARRYLKLPDHADRFWRAFDALEARFLTLNAHTMFTPHAGSTPEEVRRWHRRMDAQKTQFRRELAELRAAAGVPPESHGKDFTHEWLMRRAGSAR